MAIPPDMIRAAVSSPQAAPFSATEAKSILEIACLVVVADGRIADEEREALRIVGGVLGAKRAADVEGLVRTSTNLHTREERLERLRAVAGTLSTEPARHAAYKAATVLAMADLAAADEEFEFDLDLQDALGLAAEDADRLAGEVHEALTPPDT